MSLPQPAATQLDAGQSLVTMAKRIDAAVASLGDRPASQFLAIPFDLLSATVFGAEKTRMALFIAAPQHQGGHSRTGFAIADALGVPFPITNDDLLAKARAEEINPALLWPWLVNMRPDLFTPAEVSAAIKAGA